MKWPRLFEFEDQGWLPQQLRNQMTDALSYLIVEMRIYAPIIPELLWVMQQSRTKTVIDLCSGGSGPWDYLLGEIKTPEELIERIVLTDLYPNEQALKASSAKYPLIEYRTEPVNALNIDPALTGVRTLFSSFHHFNRQQATAILQDAVDKQMPIGIFEFTGRRWTNFLKTPVTMVVLFAKLLFAQPLTLSRLLFSYLIPVVPLIFLWDSSVSHLRSYSPAELQGLVSNLERAEAYDWEIGETGSPRTPLTNSYLIGYPKNPQ